MDSEDNISWFNNLVKHGIKLGLENIKELLELLGEPQNGMRFIHVAGTDGKGSVCAMLESVLIASNIKTGAFTSPHLLSVNECIRVNGGNISNDDMEQLLKLIRPHVEEMSSRNKVCTNFEVLTAIAFLFFKISSISIAVIEVGMGGRTDCTNIILPEVSVINNISMEHKMYLGDNIQKITYEKGGIIKHGIPCVTINNDYIYSILYNIADSIGCNIVRVKESDIKILSNNENSIEMTYKGSLYSVSLPGRYQARNAALVIETISMLHDSGYISRHIRDGLSTVFWPCRMQKIAEMPIIIDVTHTISGAICLHHDIEEIYGKVILVLGILSDKNIDGISYELSQIAIKVFIAKPNSPRAAPLDAVQSIMSEYSNNVITFPSVAQAMNAAMNEHKDVNILVTGSFCTARDALKWVQSKYAKS